MEFLNEIKTSTLIITNNKKDILEYLTKINDLKDIKIISFKELIENLTFTYDEKSLVFLCNKLNIKKTISEIYLKNIYFIEDKEYKSNKLKKLKEIKELLDKQDLLIYNKEFINYLKQKEVIIYGYNSFTKYEQNIINKLKFIDFDILESILIDN